MFRANEKDITYTRSKYNLQDHSLCLLQSIEPLSELLNAEGIQLDENYNLEDLRS